MGRDTYKYELRDGNRVVYVGITNDLERREAEHRAEGMDFTKIQKSAMSPLEALPKNGKPTELRPTSAITEATDRSVIRTTPANKVGGEYCCSSTPSSPFLP